MQALGDADHLGSARHFEIQYGGDAPRQSLDVVVLNVAPVLSEVSGDPIRAGLLAEQSCGDRIGLGGATRLPDRRHVIDIDVQALMGRKSAH